VKIRKATKKDLRQLIKLIQLADGRTKAWAIKKTKKYSEAKNREILVAIVDKKIIGFVMIDKKENDRYLLKRGLDTFVVVGHIAVHPDYRHKKIGSKLLRICETHIKKWKKRGLVLDCLKDRIPFYKNNGYVNVGYFMRATNGKKCRQYVMIKEVG